MFEKLRVQHVKFPNMSKTPGELYENLEVEHQALIAVHLYPSQRLNATALTPAPPCSLPLHLECSSLRPVEQRSPPWVSYTPLAVNAARTATADVSVRSHGPVPESNQHLDGRDKLGAPKTALHMMEQNQAGNGSSFHPCRVGVSLFLGYFSMYMHVRHT